MVKTITHEGVTYEIIEGVAKPGDLIYYCVDGGDVVGVSRVAEDGYEIDDFYTEDETYVWVSYGDSYEVIEKAPDVTDIIANLARRVSELETHLAPKECEESPARESKYDAVNSPQHYTRGKYETIDVIEHITQGYGDPFVAYCVGNTIKYADRAPYKHGSPAEDLRKAAWYLTRAADHVEGKAGDVVE